MIKYLKYFLQILLLPLGLLYGTIMEIRKVFYRTGIFKSKKFLVPVISVGNITAGGSGKTPFTIFLAEELKNHYNNIAIVSRGYRRKSKGLQLVSDGQNILLGPDEAGDEPYLMVKKMPGVICAVSEKRAEAVSYLLEKFTIDLILMDDAFQHFGVQRDLDILLIDCRQPFKFNFPFPAGSLREFRHNCRRAQIVIYTNCGSGSIPVFKWDYKSFKSSGELENLIDIQFNPAGSVFDLRGKRTAAFAGIAAPDNFRKSLEKSGLQVVEFFSFPDHHNYTEKDIRILMNKALQLHCEYLLCTEKDLVKIQSLKNTGNIFKESSCRLFGVSLNTIVENKDKLILDITALLERRKS